MTLVENLKEVLKQNVVVAEEISKVKKYIEASEKYEILVKSGLTTKRGNNLLSREKINVSQVRFNLNR